MVRRVALALAVRSAHVRQAILSSATPPLEVGALQPSPRRFLPTRTPGALRVGGLLPNPLVWTADGALVRLDAVLRGEPAVLTARRPDPLLVDLCRRQGLFLVHVSGVAPASDGWIAVRLADRTLQTLAEDPAVAVLVRPDRVVGAMEQRGKFPSSAVAHPHGAGVLRIHSSLERSSGFDRRMSGLSTGAVLGLFIVASLATCLAGLVLADSTDALDDRFQFGEALGGLILLGFAGTLPEIAITISAAATGNLGMATGNLLGGVAIQTLVLVLLDAVSQSPTPLTSMSTVLEPIVEALVVILLLTIALFGHLLPVSLAIGPVSPTSLLLVIVWLAGVLLLNRLRTSQRWRAVTEHVEAIMTAPAPPAMVNSRRLATASTGRLLVAFASAAVCTLVAGVGLERTGDELAGRWGLTGVVFGATILAAVTALPEVSSGLQALRLGRVGLAMGDVFGGNQVQLTLFLLADLVAGQPVLQTVTPNTAWLGGAGVVVTVLYAVGLVVRPPRKLLGVGPDSLLVVVAYAVALAGLVRIS